MTNWKEDEAGITLGLRRRKMIRFLFAIIMMFAVFGGLNYYISKRIYQGLICVFPNIRFWMVFGFLLLLMIVMLLGFARSMLPLPAGVKHVLGVVGSYWMGAFVYLLLFTVIADLFHLLFWMCRLPFVKAAGFHLAMSVIVVALTLITVVYGIHHARSIQHVSYEIKVEGKTDISDMNIVMISDLHLGALGSESRLEEIVEEINGLYPDLVCIAGDFFDTDFAAIREPEKAIERLRKITSTYGVYACLGNHDAGGTTAQMLDFLEECEIQVLRDEYVVIEERLVLVGRLDGSPIGGFGDMKRKELSEFLEPVDETLPVLVMDHNPANVDTYSDEADLIMSGHTHRGQMFPGSLFTDHMFTVDYGYYRRDENSPHVIVTSGVGYWGMPMRVGTDSEIISIRVIP